MSKYQPLYDNLVVKVKKVEQQTASGLYIGTPEEIRRTQAAETIGEITEIGENCFLEMPSKPKIGDKIVFARYAGLEREEKEGKNEKGEDDIQYYRIIRDIEVLALHKE